MTAGDIALLAGELVSCWVAGFCGGYLITRFREAVSHVS